jgi:hypothetical protein
LYNAASRGRLTSALMIMGIGLGFARK